MPCGDDGVTKGVFRQLRKHIFLKLYRAGISAELAGRALPLAADIGRRGHGFVFCAAQALIAVSQQDAPTIPPSDVLTSGRLAIQRQGNRYLRTWSYALTIIDIKLVHRLSREIFCTAQASLYPLVHRIAAGGQDGVNRPLRVIADGDGFGRQQHIFHVVVFASHSRIATHPWC